jgi:hypothetical protein
MCASGYYCLVIMNYAEQIRTFGARSLIVKSAAESTGNYCTRMNETRG